jgi:hypothetical protein
MYSFWRHLSNKLVMLCQIIESSGRTNLERWEENRPWLILRYYQIFCLEGWPATRPNFKPVTTRIRRGNANHNTAELFNSRTKLLFAQWSAVCIQRMQQQFYKIHGAGLPEAKVLRLTALTLSGLSEHTISPRIHHLLFPCLRACSVMQAYS